MSDSQVPPSGSSVRDSVRLESWKEIAAYLHRDVTTVRRWEKKEGLPVHRHVHDKLGSVYAYRAELEQWLTQRSFQPPRDQGGPQGSSRRRWARVAAASAVLALVGVWLILQSTSSWWADRDSLSGRSAFSNRDGDLINVPARMQRAGPEETEPIVIAVLPLENLGPRAEDEDFADGLTDEIIRNLSGIEGLAVRSRTSSFAFKGKTRNVREVGEQLGATHILEGSVSRADERLRVIVQLVRVRDDVLLWSGRYDRRLQDIFAIQDEISLGIVNNLRLSLGRGRRKYETSIEVYELYLRGLALAGRVGRQGGAVQGIELFELAVAKDRTFAPAHAALATAYSIRSVIPAGREDDVLKMRAAAERALQLDPMLAEGHVALGAVYSREGRWDESIRSFQRAVELDPNRAATYRECVDWLLMPLGRLDEALAQARLAAQLDPLWPEMSAQLAYVLLSLGHYDEAADQSQRMPVLNENRIQFLARARLGQGRVAEAIRLLTTEDTSPNRGFLGWAYARSGRRAEAEQIAAATPAERPNVQALVYAGLHDNTRAFEALDRMAARFGPPRVGRYLTYPELSALRSDARMVALRRRIGLTP